MARLDYEVNITGADNGLVVRLGCKTLVFTDKEGDGDIKTFMNDLYEYLSGGNGACRKLYIKYFGEEKNTLAGGCVENAPVQGYPEAPPCNTNRQY